MLVGRIVIYLCISLILWCPEFVRPWSFQPIVEIFRGSRGMMSVCADVNATCTTKVKVPIFASQSKPHAVERKPIFSFVQLSRLASSINQKWKKYNVKLKGLVSKTWVNMKALLSTKPKKTIPVDTYDERASSALPTGSSAEPNPSPAGNSPPPVTDRFEMDVNLLPLTKQQHQQLLTIYHNLHHNVLNSTLLAEAAATNFPITPHVIYRYLAASEWESNYMGKT
jgi:hypothetical protein